MYLSERDRIFKLIDTIDEALSIIDSTSHYLFDDCIGAFEIMCKSLETFNVNFDFSIIKDSMHKLISLKDTSDKKDIINEIELIRNNLVEFDKVLSNEKVKYRAVFLPYQASTWYSLESIWKAAVNDPDCEPYVIPLPYWDIITDEKGNEVNRQYNYNGRQFPKDVPIINYRSFDIQSAQPEMIFINHPYDEQNIPIKIAEEYYSKNLINYTNMLVYSSYSNAISYNEKNFNKYYNREVLKYADKIIVQSEFIKDIYVKHKNDKDKFLTFGSPKTDAIINLTHNPVNIPEIWERKLSGKKVFLLNINLNYFIYSYHYAVQEGTYYAVLFINDIIKTFMEKGDCGLIFRPHPSLKKYLKTKAPHCLDVLSRLDSFIVNSENCVYDTFGNYTNAFMCSDALISTPGTLVSDFIPTKKPILNFNEFKMEKKINKESPLNYNLSEYNYDLKLTDDEGITLDEFIEMVIKGEDPKLNDRMEAFNKIFNNVDGTVGQKIYNEIKKSIM